MSDGEKDFYLEYSTIFDAPITKGMSLADFQMYYRQRYGIQGMKVLPIELENAKLKGSSSDTIILEDIFKNNKAGDNKNSLNKQEMLEKYCSDK